MVELGYANLEASIQAARELLQKSESGAGVWSPAQTHGIDTGQGKYPALHERQIENAHDWFQDRARRIEAHQRRVHQHVQEDPIDRRESSVPKRGRARRVWCVEQRTVFASVALAARSVDRASSNILQAIRLGYQCAGLHWNYFDPALHVPAAMEPAN